MRFASPYWLYLLTLLPIVALFYFFAARSRAAAMRRLASHRLNVPGALRRGRVMSQILLLAGLALVITALARPQIGQSPDRMERMGIDITFMIDASHSMSAEDVQPNRFEQAKAAVREIMRQLKGDRISLSMFTNASLRIIPHTTDYEALEYFLDIAEMKVFINRGTNMETALNELLRIDGAGSAEKTKIIIILSDGEDEPALEYTMAQDLAHSNIRVFTVGIGTETGAPVPIRSDAGQLHGYIKNSKGEQIVTFMDETPLKKIAAKYRGKYFRYSPAAVPGVISGMREIKGELIEEREELVFNESFHYFLLAGLVLLFAGKARNDE